MVQGSAVIPEPETGAVESSTADDTSLLRSVARQDREAFEVLYRRYYPRLYRYLLRLVRRSEVVAEIVNDVMMVVWQKAGSFEERSQPSTWILGIAYRKGVKALRTLANQPVVVSPETAASFEDPEPARRQADLEMGMVLQSVLEGLSPEQRAVVELTYHYGYSYREIAQITGVPVNTVKTRMFYARKRLKESWSDRMESGGAGPPTGGSS
jgi:RNA polymerase sigma-70 factor (ECF subfamily)